MDGFTQQKRPGHFYFNGSHSVHGQEQSDRYRNSQYPFINDTFVPRSRSTGSPVSPFLCLAPLIGFLHFTISRRSRLDGPTCIVHHRPKSAPRAFVDEGECSIGQKKKGNTMHSLSLALKTSGEMEKQTLRKLFPGSNHHELSCDRLTIFVREPSRTRQYKLWERADSKGGATAKSATGHGALISTDIQLDYDPYYRTSSCVFVSKLALFIHLRQIIPLARGGATLKRVRAAECNVRRFAKVQTRRNDVTPVCPASGLTNLNEPYKLRRTAIKGHALTRLSF